MRQTFKNISSSYGNLRKQPNRSLVIPHWCDHCPHHPLIHALLRSPTSADGCPRNLKPRRSSTHFAWVEKEITISVEVEIKKTMSSFFTRLPRVCVDLRSIRRRRIHAFARKTIEIESTIQKPRKYSAVFLFKIEIKKERRGSSAHLTLRLLPTNRHTHNLSCCKRMTARSKTSVEFRLESISPHPMTGVKATSRTTTPPHATEHLHNLPFVDNLLPHRIEVSIIDVERHWIAWQDRRSAQRASCNIFLRESEETIPALLPFLRVLGIDSELSAIEVNSKLHNIHVTAFERGRFLRRRRHKKLLRHHQHIRILCFCHGISPS